MIVTLLSEKESPDSIFKECRGLGIQFFHIPLNGANAAILSDKKSVKIIRDSVKELYEILCTER